MMSRSSITPLVTAVKWVRKLSEAIVSTSRSGAQSRKKLSTSSRPAMVNRKHTVALMMKAMTWFLVNAEMHDPIARKAPAMNRLPI